ncbi:MAG: TIGR04282 family arsenosugar biosynthesis glycosyltransferase [Pseudomonadota bacterium]
MTANRPIPLFLFAKSPEPGKVKTRLMPQCSARQAADLAKILLEEACRAATKYWPGEVVLAVWPDQQHPFIRTLAERFSLRMVTQVGGDLGEKMHQVCEQAGYPVAVMGCDAPHVTPATLMGAFQHLEHGRPVLGPAEDGGYYLLGLTRGSKEIFTGIEWGGPKVLGHTLKKAKESNIELTLLPSLNDVDTWQDVLDLASSKPAIRDYLAAEKLL